MSYGSAPPPSGGTNPYGSVPEDDQPSAPYGTPSDPPPPPPVFPQPWQTPGGQAPEAATGPGNAYGTPPASPPGQPGPPGYGPPPGQTFGGPTAQYSPYTAAGRYPGPGAPGYGGWIANSRDNGKGTGALFMGIFSILLCFGSLIGIGLGVGAVIMGVQGRQAAQGGTADNGGVATAGLVLGIIGLVLSVLTSIGYLVNLG